MFSCGDTGFCDVGLAESRKGLWFS